MSKVTQKQIAKKARVSQTTVSLILNNSQDIVIGEETRQRVLAIARDLGYVPQAAARSLVQGRSSNIGLVLIQPHYQVFRDPYIPNIITGLSEVTREQGFRLLVEHINSIDEIDTIRTMIKGGEVAGIVLANFKWAESVVAPLIEERYPIVLLERMQSAGYSCVYIAHYQGVKTAVSHLAGLGHQRIACIPYGPVDHPHITMRFAAYYEALEEAGLPRDERLVRYGNYDPDSGYRAMRSLLEDGPQPTAVFGMNDLMALGAMRAIQEHGLRIPDDIAVMGYDDMRFAAFTSPPLTTIHAPEVETGQQAGQMLIDRINGDQAAQSQVVLPVDLVIRHSCGAAR